MAPDNITVRVSARGPLRKYVTAEEAEIPRSSTASALVSFYRVPAEHHVIVIKDGKRLSPTSELHDGDSVILITMMSGG